MKKVLWEGGDDRISFSPDKSVAEGSGGQVALCTPFSKGSMISLQFAEGKTLAGVALEGYENSGKSYKSKQIIVVDNDYLDGLPLVRGETKFGDSRGRKNKSKVGVGDTVRVVHHGKCVEFFANQQEFDEKTPWFSVDDVTGQVRPVVIFSQQGKVKVQGSTKVTRKRLALFCTKTQDANEATECSAERPCSRA